MCYALSRRQKKIIKKKLLPLHRLSKSTKLERMEREKRNVKKRESETEKRNCVYMSVCV